MRCLIKSHAGKIPVVGVRHVATLYLLVIVLAITGRCTGQTIATADWFQRDLGQGVVWRHYLFDNLHGNPQSISYIDADLNNPNVAVQFPYLAAARQKTSTFVPSQFPQAKAAINGSYFATSGSGGHVTYLRINNGEIPPGGDLFAPFGYEGALGLTAAGSASIIKMPSGGWANNATHPNIMACGPIVLFNGAVPTAALAAIGAHSTARHPRSAVGLTPGNHLILLTVDGRTAQSFGMSCTELGQTMQELGCTYGLNLDGGGSTTLWGAGEMYNGVINYPTDNGEYDHLGERAVSNAISVTAVAATPRQWDGRLASKSYSRFMANGSSQTVTLTYKNIGTSTWTAANTRLVLSRPSARTSLLQAATWVSASQPATMTPASVATGQTATFTFTLQSAVLTQNTALRENFMLTQSGVGRIGPADSEAAMDIFIQLPAAPFSDFIVESRPGGQNFGWYSDSGMADTSTDCTAPGITPNIGTRYGSTFRSVAGGKSATVAPDFPADGFYKVYVAWPAGSLRQSPVTYHVNIPGVSDTFQLDQLATANTWVPLRTAPYFFEKGYSGSVVMTNEDIDVSGNMYAGAVKFEYVPTPAPEKSFQVNYLQGAAARPTIDGIASPGEWTAAAPAASGFVRHDNPSTAATEDGNFQMLYDDTKLYIRYSMTDALLPSYPVPPANLQYTDLGEDKINFFFTPGGVNRQKFYRVVLSPNTTNGTCYVWSQASLTKTTNASTGTTWKPAGSAAYSYNGSQLTIEYSIPWSQFNYPDMQYASAPADGDRWGVQPSLSNRVTASTSESVNWEPDTTAGFVMGEPFGELRFVRPVSHIDDWNIY